MGAPSEFEVRKRPCLLQKIPTHVNNNNTNTQKTQKFIIEGHALEFVDIGPSPTTAQYEAAVSESSQQRYTLTRPLAAYAAAKELYNPKDKPPFSLPWFRSIAATCRTFQPDILMLVFTSWCGAAVIPALLGLHTRVVVSYPMPLAPTGEFCVPMAGTGHSLGFSWLNRLQWQVSERMIVLKIHLKAAKRNIELFIAEEQAAGRGVAVPSVSLDDSISSSGLTTLYAFSPSLLSKPADWPAQYHVIGQLGGRKTVATHKPLPPPLQAYLDECRRHSYHVVYIGFGSLGFFPKEKVTFILDTAAAAVSTIAATHPVRAVIQTTLSSTPGKTGTMSASSGGGTNITAPGSTQPAAYMTFSETVDHAALFAQTSLVVSHGGIGTVSTALATGKPVLSVCCLPTADQSFWADVCFRRYLGPSWFWVDALTEKKLMDGILDGLGKHFELYTKNAESLAKQMAKERAEQAAIEVLDAEVKSARKTK